MRTDAFAAEVERLTAIALIYSVFPDTEQVDAGDLGGMAAAYAANHWEVFPLKPRSKVPSTDHAVLDATSDFDRVARWWATTPDANIGGRVPAGLFVIDIDPRKTGAVEWVAEQEATHGRLPETMTCISGRGDNGRHLYFRHPGGKLTLTGTRKPPGIDLKTHSGYCVLPPSVHPDTGGRYRWASQTLVPAPEWLVELLRPAPVPPHPRRPSVWGTSTDSPADWYSDTRSWSEVLEPHGWRCAGDPDRDGAVWLHPQHTSDCSATVRHGLLFVYSPNTPFPVTEPGDPHGLTRFRAFAILDHAGDLTAAAHAAIKLRKAVV